MISICRTAVLALMLASVPGRAQEAVVGVADAEALFTSPDPKLHANKQLAYRIIRDLLEANRWDKADQYLTERYIQHNPNAGSGRDAVVRYFTQVVKAKPTPIPQRIATPVVSVVAEGDLVMVATVSTIKATDRAKAYTTTWFDMWRIKDGKADEHWDGALKP